MLAAHSEIPPGTVPSCMCSDQDLRNCGFDPAEVRQLENELSEMGLGLGISIGGIFRGIGKVGKGIFKVGKTVVRTAVPVAASFIPGGTQILGLLPGGGGGPPPPPGYSYGSGRGFGPFGRPSLAPARPLVPAAGYPAPIGYPMPTSYPSPPPGPAPFGMAGMPQWLLPAVLGLGVLMVLK